MKFCQSCGMPLQAEDQWGTNADGSLNEEYCCYCYQKGAVSYTHLNSIPALIRPIVGNGFVMGVITVLILEHLIFRSGKKAKKE